MDKETVEKIFELGADALYKTIDPNNGNVCKQSYSILKDEAVKLFAIPDVIPSACNEYIEGINMDCAVCEKPKFEHRH